MKTRVYLIILMVVCLFANILFADVPRVINYQGFLKDKGVPVTGGKNIVFKLYDSLTLGSNIWTSPSESITIIDGLYTYKIGSSPGTPAFDTIDWQHLSGVYLEVVVEDISVTPRVQLVSVPFAFSVADDSIITSNIKSNSVTVDKLDNDIKYGSGFGLVPVGSIVIFPSTNVKGWLICDGRIIDKSLKSEYSNLVSFLQATGNMNFHGSALNSNQAKLPDLRGVFVRGIDVFQNGYSGLDPFGIRKAGHYQIDLFKEHRHGYSSTVGNSGQNSGGSGPDRNVGSQTTLKGGSETRPKNVAMYYMIKY